MTGITARAPTALVLAALLSGCVSPAGTGPAHPANPATPSPVPPVTGEPPAERGLATLLVVPARSGSAELGTVAAVPGDLWVEGRCTGGELQLRLDPVAVLPVPCDQLGAVPFVNQVVMRRPTQVRVSVVAPVGVTWNLRVQQAGGAR